MVLLVGLINAVSGEQNIVKIIHTVQMSNMAPDILGQYAFPNGCNLVGTTASIKLLFLFTYGVPELLGRL